MHRPQSLRAETLAGSAGRLTQKNPVGSWKHWPKAHWSISTYWTCWKLRRKSTSLSCQDEAASGIHKGSAGCSSTILRFATSDMYAKSKAVRYRTLPVKTCACCSAPSHCSPHGCRFERSRRGPLPGSGLKRADLQVSHRGPATVAKSWPEASLRSQKRRTHGWDRSPSFASRVMSTEITKMDCSKLNLSNWYWESGGLLFPE